MIATARAGLLLLIGFLAFGCARLPAQSVGEKLASGPAAAETLSSGELEEAFPVSGQTESSDRGVSQLYGGGLRGPFDGSTPAATDLLAQYDAMRDSSGSLEAMMAEANRLLDPWLAAHVAGSTVVFSAIQAVSTPEGLQWVPAPCFRVAVRAEADRIADEGRLAVAYPNYDEGSFVKYRALPFIATTRRFVVGYDSLLCALAVRSVLRGALGGDKFTPAAIAALIDIAPPPPLELAFESAPAARAWASKLDRAPEIGAAPLSATQGFALLRNRARPTEILVVPLARAEIDPRVEPAKYPQKSWLGNVTKLDVYRVQQTPWVLALK